MGGAVDQTDISALQCKSDSIGSTTQGQSSTSQATTTTKPLTTKPTTQGQSSTSQDRIHKH